MNDFIDTVASWMPAVSLLFVVLEIAAVALSIIWRRRGAQALRAHDYERGMRYLDEAPKFGIMAVFIAILPSVDRGVPLLVGAMMGTFTVPPSIAHLTDRISVGLIVITIISVTLLIAEMKFHRFMAADVAAERRYASLEQKG